MWIYLNVANTVWKSKEYRLELVNMSRVERVCDNNEGGSLLCYGMRWEGDQNSVIEARESPAEVWALMQKLK